MVLSGSWINQPWAILLLIVLIFGAICLFAFVLRKFVINKNRPDEKPDEVKAANETLDRYLEEVKDPEAQKQFDEYDKKQNK